ncbi:unnamed protein product [Meloidogyne enterolobii]|uniref:Uncharacterized protein n=1 Tax=Meloidogyne enterolobii TaxID=390850 RepID=A0ACB1ABG4_MELEN
MYYFLHFNLYIFKYLTMLTTSLAFCWSLSIFGCHACIDRKFCKVIICFVMLES